MCTSLAVNNKKTIIGWNLDLLDMEYRVRPTADGVYIEINDASEGWMPLFGANARGDFVGMPTCWPSDARSDPTAGAENIILLDVDLLLQKKTLREIREIAETRPVCSVPGLTFMGSLSDAEGNVLHIVPGQGVRGTAVVLPRPPGGGEQAAGRLQRGLRILPLPLLPHIKAVHLATGMHTDTSSMLTWGARGYNTERIANVILGQKADADVLPKRLTDVQQNPDDPRTKVPLDVMRKVYYRGRGWKHGIPTYHRLKTLGIVLDALQTTIQQGSTHHVEVARQRVHDVNQPLVLCVVIV